MLNFTILFQIGESPLPFQEDELSPVGIAADRSERNSDFPAIESRKSQSNSTNTNDSKTSIVTNYSETPLNQLKITLEVGGRAELVLLPFP